MWNVGLQVTFHKLSMWNWSRSCIWGPASSQGVVISAGSEDTDLYAFCPLTLQDVLYSCGLCVSLLTMADSPRLHRTAEALVHHRFLAPGFPLFLHRSFGLTLAAVFPRLLIPHSYSWPLKAIWWFASWSGRPWKRRSRSVSVCSRGECSLYGLKRCRYPWALSGPGRSSYGRSCMSPRST